MDQQETGKKLKEYDTPELTEYGEIKQKTLQIQLPSDIIDGQ